MIRGPGSPGQVPPRPVDEDDDLVAEADQVDEVQAQPGQPAERAPHDPATAELGDGRPTPDGGHDPLVLVGEGRGRPTVETGPGPGGRRGRRTGSPPGPPAGRCRRPRVPDPPHSTAAASPTAQTPSWPGTARSWSTTRRPFGPGRRVDVPGHRALDGDAAGPHHGAGRDDGAVVEFDRVGADRLDRLPQPQLDAPAGQRVGRVVGGRLAERGEQPVEGVDQDDPTGRAVEPEAVVSDGHVEQLGQGTGHLHPGGAASDDDEGERPPGVGPLGMGVDVLQPAQDVVAQPTGVGQRVEREAVLRGPGDAEELGRGAAGHDQRVEGERIRSRPPGPRAGPSRRRSPRPSGR